MPRKRKALLSIILAVSGLSLYCLLTGGVTYGTTRWFGGQRDAPMQDGSKVSLWLNPSQTQWDIPFVAHYYSAYPPYTLLLFFPSPDLSYQSIEIKEAVVVYDSGLEERQTGTLRREMSRGLALWDPPLRDLVKRHENCTITVTGNFLKTDGEKTEFSLSCKFDAEKKKTIFAPYWALP